MPELRAVVSRYLVTGCAGFIGSHLCEALLDRGDEVLGIDSFTDYYPQSTKVANLASAHGSSAFSFHELDLSAAPIEPLLEGVDGIFHLAAQAGVRGSWGKTFPLYVRDNVIATQRVFEAAVVAGTRVVWASSSSIYGNAETFPTREDARPSPVSPYGVTKLSCEHLAGAYAVNAGLDAVALRYFTVYGPRQRPDMSFTRIVTALAEGRTFTIYGSGEQSRSFTYVEDAVGATIAAMERGRGGDIYNVGGGSETTLLEVIRLCEELSGRQLAVRHESWAAGDARRTSADTSLARSELDWEPQTRIEEGVAEQLAWAGVAAERV